jgi:hypothetical protein
VACRRLLAIVAIAACTSRAPGDKVDPVIAPLRVGNRARWF